MNTSIQIDPVKDGKRLLMVCIAAFIMALNIRTLVHTGGLIPGGATGMTILIQRLVKLLLSVDLPYTPVNLLLNAIPVYIGFRFIGKKFHTLTQDMLLISVFGGIVNGFSISLCLRADATSGGTDFIAIYLSQMHGVESWNLILGFNAVLLLIGGYFFGPDKALYSIIFQYASTQVLHLMHRNYQKVTFLIVTDKPEQICAGIHDMTHHGDHGKLLYAAKRLKAPGAPVFCFFCPTYILYQKPAVRNAATASGLFYCIIRRNCFVIFNNFRILPSPSL